MQKVRSIIHDIRASSRSNVIHNSDGSIEIGVVGEDLPLLNLTDKNPLPIKYISFCSWGTAETKFFYDCRTPACTYNIELYFNFKRYINYLKKKNQSQIRVDWMKQVEGIYHQIRDWH